jgi:hypothetical protein
MEGGYMIWLIYLLWFLFGFFACFVLLALAAISAKSRSCDSCFLYEKFMEEQQKACRDAVAEMNGLNNQEQQEVRH